MANRTAERVETLVAGLPDTASGTVETRDLDDLVTLLGEADVAFTSVGTAHPLVGRDHLEAALVRRTGRPDLVVVDLGVPRNVEPSAAGLDGLVLLDMDDLRAAVADALAGRQDEVAAANVIVVRRGGALPGRVPGPRRGADGRRPCGRASRRPGGPSSTASGPSGPISTTPSGSRWTRSPGPWWPSCSTSRRWP